MYALKAFNMAVLHGTQVYQTRECVPSRYHNYMRGENGVQTLLIDADDTLWENNIYFERAIANFITFLDHREHTPERVRLILNDVERESIVKHGYGLHSFSHSLVDCFEKLSVEPVTPELHERIRSFANQIADHPIEVLPSVPETLQYLGERHHLIMMTKGESCRAIGKSRTLGTEGIFCRGRDRLRERRIDLPLRYLQVRASCGYHMDGRQQPQVRHQPGPRRGLARRLYTPRQHMDSGA